MYTKIKNLFNNEHYLDIVKSGGIVLVIRILAALIALALTATITNQFGAQQAGNYFFIIAFLSFLASFASFGLFNALLKEVSIYGESLINRSSIMIKSIIIVCVGTIITSFLLYIFNEFSSYLGYEHVIINTYLTSIIYILFPFTLTFLLSNYFQATKNMIISMFMLNFGYQLFMIIILFLYHIQTIQELLFVFDISIIMVALIGIYSYFRYGGQCTIGGDKTFKSLLILSMPMMTAHIVSQINSFSGLMFLSIFSDETSLGYYGVALRIALIMSFLIMSVNKVVAPKFATLYHDGKIFELKKVVIFSNRLLLLTSLPILLIIIIFGKEILHLFGDGFENAYSALVIIAVGQFFASVSGTVVFLLQMTGSEKIIRNNIIIATLFNMVLGFILVPYLGLIGASIATSTGLISVNVLASFKANRILGINPLLIFKVGK